MKRSHLSTLAISLLFALGAAYTDNLPTVAQLEAQFQHQLNTRDETYGQPRATSFYDDEVDHFEQGQLMRDTIAKGI